MRLISL
jgi:hypothetical protein